MGFIRTTIHVFECETVCGRQLYWPDWAHTWQNINQINLVRGLMRKRNVGFRVCVLVEVIQTEMYKHNHMPRWWCIIIIIICANILCTCRLFCILHISLAPCISDVPHPSCCIGCMVSWARRIPFCVILRAIKDTCHSVLEHLYAVLSQKNGNAAQL